MADFKRNSSRGRDTRGAPRGRPRGDSSRGRPSFRDGGRGGRGRDNDRGGKLEFTKVTCSSCGKACEVPFKPSSNKPVYCSDCFEGEDKKPSKGNSGKDLDIINKKLDKIMKALKIE
jgi:CxxC-x17-CxxC domain-containing protein